MTQEPKRFFFRIQYQTIEISEVSAIADNEEQAKRYALKYWRDSHADKCIDPIITAIGDGK